MEFVIPERCEASNPEISSLHHLEIPDVQLQI
ncbi:MAG: hypothetical protein QOI87_571 [Bradyrhizobium sp.]|jgi:hypothetical protein|nr:hypothetical protein [Bradyrhizobium sp.]